MSVRFQSPIQFVNFGTDGRIFSGGFPGQSSRSVSPNTRFISPPNQRPIAVPDVRLFAAHTTGAVPQPSQISPRYPSPVAQQQPRYPSPAQQAPRPQQQAQNWHQIGHSDSAYRNISPNSLMPMHYPSPTQSFVVYEASNQIRPPPGARWISPIEQRLNTNISSSIVAAPPQAPGARSGALPNGRYTSPVPGAEYAGLTIRNDGTLVNGQNRVPPSLAFEQQPEGSSSQRRNSPTQGGQPSAHARAALRAVLDNPPNVDPRFLRPSAEPSMHHSVGRIIHGGSEGITRPQRDTFLRHQGPQQSPLPQQRQHIAPNTHLRNTFNGSQNFPPAVEVDLRTSDPKIHEMYATHAHYSSLNKQKPVMQRSSAPIVGEKVSPILEPLHSEKPPQPFPQEPLADAWMRNSVSEQDAWMRNPMSGMTLAPHSTPRLDVSLEPASQAVDAPFYTPDVDNGPLGLVLTHHTTPHGDTIFNMHKVADVLHDSIAWRCGLKKDDMLIRVNDLLLDSMSPQDLRHHFSQYEQLEGTRSMTIEALRTSSFSADGNIPVSNLVTLVLTRLIAKSSASSINSQPHHSQSPLSSSHPMRNQAEDTEAPAHHAPHSTPHQSSQEPPFSFHPDPCMLPQYQHNSTLTTQHKSSHTEDPIIKEFRQGTRIGSPLWKPLDAKMPATGSGDGLVDAVIMCDYDRPNNRNASKSDGKSQAVIALSSPQEGFGSRNATTPKNQRKTADTAGQKPSSPRSPLPLSSGMEPGNNFIVDYSTMKPSDFSTRKNRDTEISTKPQSPRTATDSLQPNAHYSSAKIEIKDHSEYVASGFDAWSDNSENNNFGTSSAQSVLAELSVLDATTRTTTPAPSAPSGPHQQHERKRRSYDYKGLRAVPEDSQLQTYSPPSAAASASPDAGPPEIALFQPKSLHSSYDLASEWSSIQTANEDSMRLHRELML